MMVINADLHIHSRFSISTSKNMTFETLSIEAPKKGVNLVGTGDCLHHKWLKELKELEKVGEGTFELNETRFIPTAEVQANKRVHHLLIFPSLSSVEQFRESIEHLSKNLDTDGRPHVRITGEQVGDFAKSCDALFGPCHAFTPWTGMYGAFNSIKECYGDLTNDVSFLELGLSADSSYANRISELKNVTLLSNSDAHSPYPLRLAREFNQFSVRDITFKEIKKAILRQGGRKCILNVGLPPQEGKYNQSACSKCYNKFSLKESIDIDWKCYCGGRIKKGVSDRVEELSQAKNVRIPKHRPDYLHIIPLIEIISKVLGHAGTNTAAVKNCWEKLISEFGNEINVLLMVNFDEIEDATDYRIANAIDSFRKNQIIIHPGGGGKYGEIELPKIDWFNR